jgi:DNA mismatch repair ATPase MutS
MLVRFLDVPLLYSLQVTFAVESWRRVHGRSVRRWLDALGEIEALSSLAAYCYEHPDDPFAEIVERETPLFEGKELGHPLLAAKTCVRNSVALGEAVQVLLVSGSNMSGKSTFLRTIGINAVLAMAGAPVRARSLKLTRVRLGAAIRVTDSLQQGRSGFYAEITRLRQIMDLAAADPFVLFLADELLHGTNSHDRRIGAEGLIRALLERGAIGVVTTHDLALTSVADPHLRNAHFQDELRDGRMVFDYRLQDGVVTKSNALELMRSVGLDV